MLGKNGCGKSTLLRTLAGLLPAINGSFTIHPNVPSTAASGCPTHPSIALVLTERLSLESTRYYAEYRPKTEGDKCFYTSLRNGYFSPTNIKIADYTT